MANQAPGAQAKGHSALQDSGRRSNKTNFPYVRYFYIVCPIVLLPFLSRGGWFGYAPVCTLHTCSGQHLLDMQGQSELSSAILVVEAQ